LEVKPLSHPEMHEVDSTMIARIGHDDVKRELHVEFHTGKRYVYEGVDPDEFHALRTADSVGKHFNAHIRKRINRSV
jgi:KTSC domain